MKTFRGTNYIRFHIWHIRKKCIGSFPPRPVSLDWRTSLLSQCSLLKRSRSTQIILYQRFMHIFLLHHIIHMFYEWWFCHTFHGLNIWLFAAGRLVYCKSCALSATTLLHGLYCFASLPSSISNTVKLPKPLGNLYKFPSIWKWKERSSKAKEIFSGSSHFMS